MSVKYLECNKEYVGDSIQEKQGDYTLEDCVLIRTTDVFPFNGIIETAEHGNAFLYDRSYILGIAMEELLRKKYEGMDKSEETRDKFYEELKEINVAAKSYRSSIHFTINGLVSSHLYGDFDNRAFVIIEPLKNHIKDPSLLSFNACDTYFNDDMKLSNEAIILIEKSVYEKIKDKEEYKEVLNNMEVYVYTGNQQEAIATILQEHGYDSFKINNNGYVNGLKEKTAAKKMWKFLEKYREENHLEAIPHIDSEYDYRDQQKTSLEAEKSDMKNFIYIFERAIQDDLLDKELIDKINTALELDKENNISYLKELNKKYYHFGQSYNDYGASYLLKIVPEMVEKIGLEKLKQYIKEFNELFTNQQLDNMNNKKAFNK